MSTITVRVLDEGQPGPSGPTEIDDADSQTESRVIDYLRGRAARDVEIDEDLLARSLGDITSKLDKVIAAQDASAKDGFRVESFTVGLAVSGTGKVVLVGELGIEASIQVTFSRG